MYIVDASAAEAIKEKYLVLELDTVIDPTSGKQKTFYSVVDHISLEELPLLEHCIEAHQQLIFQYKLKNWEYCFSACQGLQGKFNGHMDSFYQHLQERLGQILQGKTRAC